MFSGSLDKHLLTLIVKGFKFNINFIESLVYSIPSETQDNIYRKSSISKWSWFLHFDCSLSSPIKIGYELFCCQKSHSDIEFIYYDRNKGNKVICYLDEQESEELCIFIEQLISGKNISHQYLGPKLIHCIANQSDFETESYLLSVNNFS